MPLGLADKTGAQWVVTDDCRQLFPPLTALVGLFDAGGDGQEAMPGQALPQFLRVWAPLPGSRILFTAAGNGVAAATPAAAGSATVQSLIVTTGEDRVAACGWKLDPAGGPSQTLTATLIDAANQPFGVPVIFDANLSIASQVAYDPSKCDNLAGVGTVQDAIDKLCQTHGEDPGIRVGRLILLAAGQELRNDIDVPVQALAKGIEIDLDGPIDPDAVSGKPTCFLTIEMPYPLNDSDRHFWGDPPVVGFQPLVLAADVEASDASIFWQPNERTIAWLAALLQMMLKTQRGERLLVRLTLQGNFIWSSKDKEVFLDGDSFGTPDNGQTELLRDANGLLSGDGRRGGDFRMWFWLRASDVPGVAPRLDVFDLKDTVVAGRTARATVTITEAAPPEGVVVQVKTDRPDLVKVPDQVMVPPGSTLVRFMVTAGALPNQEPTPVTVTIGTLGEERDAPLTVIPPAG